MAQLIALTEEEKEQIRNRAPVSFRKWHVESLLNQSADLLDRCLRDAAEYYDLRSRWYLFDLERQEATAADSLIQEQVDAGMLNVEHDQLNLETKTHQGKQMIDG